MRRYAFPPPHPNPYPSQSGDSSTVPPLRWLFQPGRDKGTEPGRGHPHVLLLGVLRGSSLPGAPRELPLGEGRGAQRLLRAVGKGVWGDPGGSPAAGTALPESRKPRGRGRRGQGKRSPRPQPGGCQSCLAAGSFPKHAAETLRGAAGMGAGPCTSPPANTRPQSPSTVTPRWGLSAPSLRGHCELSGPGEVAREAGSIPAPEPAAAGRTGMRCPSCGGTHSNCPLVVPEVRPVPPAPGSSSVLLLAIQNCCHHGVKDTTGVAIVTA